jgi:hypothetical protein
MDESKITEIDFSVSCPSLYIQFVLHCCLLNIKIKLHIKISTVCFLFRKPTVACTVCFFRSLGLRISRKSMLLLPRLRSLQLLLVLKQILALIWPFCLPFFRFFSCFGRRVRGSPFSSAGSKMFTSKAACGI